MSAMNRGFYGLPAAGQNRFHGREVFTGSGKFRMPEGVAKILVTVIGGGGGGGGRTAGGSSQDRGGGGGGGGGAAIRWIDNKPGEEVTVTVGGGGAGQTGAGSTGGTSSFGAYCSASGGGGGAGDSLSEALGGAGGLGADGDLNIRGAGGHPSNAGSFASQNGGDSILGGGGRANGITPQAGSVYGGGGAGSRNVGNVTDAGEAGAQGIVIVEW